MVSSQSFFFTDFVSQKNKNPLVQNGGLRTKATIARIGLQRYPIGDKWVDVLRSEEAVKGSVSSQTLPITVEHPEAFLDGDMQSELVVGVAKNLRYIDGIVTAYIEVTDAIAIAKATTTHRYLSLGYHGSLIPQQGVWIDALGLHGHINERYSYEYVQQIGKLDHLALVSRPRAGAIARLNDSFTDAVQDYTEPLKINRKRDLPQIQLDDYLSASRKRDLDRPN